MIGCLEDLPRWPKMPGFASLASTRWRRRFLSRTEYLVIFGRPLETTQVTLPSGRVLTVPTAEEALRIKGFLIVRRNQTRDYLDVAALADRQGLHEAAGILARIDDYYADQHGGGRGVAAQLIRQLADPRPKDSSVTGQLGAYRNLAPRWTDWDEVRSVCRQLAAEMLEAEV